MLLKLIDNSVDAYAFPGYVGVNSECPVRRLNKKPGHLEYDLLSFASHFDESWKLS